jgi:conjugative relaxase-like TrwC/TraI family protein
MVNISKALNAQKVQNYHATDYENPEQKSYYTQDDHVTGQWHGQLGEEMGLTGAVSAEHFKRLAEGQDPNTGQQLVRHRIATDQSAAHRAGWDATFSAPKSVSVTALVGNDHRIIEAHREAVQKGLDYLQRSVEARIGGNAPSQPTAKWVAATFEHDTSRPVQGYSAPQLHTHAVFFNITKTADGVSHALQERHIFDAQKTATAIYQAELGYRLRQLGYELEEGKGGAREIKGYTPEYLKANSSRSEQIDAVAKQLEAQGLNKAEARQRAAHSTRESKGHLPTEQTRAQQQALATAHGNQHEAIIAQAHIAELRNRHTMTPKHAQQAASQALTYSRDKSFEREAVVPQREILREALHRGQDLTTPALIEAAIQARQDKGDLLPMKGKGHQLAYTTPEMLAMETQNIQLMKAGQNQRTAFIDESPALTTRIDPHFAKFEANAAKQPDPARRLQLEAAITNQKQAVRNILTSHDQVQALQGAAGTGKTTSLTVVRKKLEQEGYAVKGLAPTSRAAAQLAECGAQCSTLQMHLATPQQSNQQPTVYFVDETSLASTKQINELLTRLAPADRVVLIGDVRQHESVDAGRPFAQLQEQGIRTARLDGIVRQNDQTLKQVVEHLAEGRIPEAVSMLQAQGRVSEIANESDRFTTIANEYLKDPAGTLVVSPDNRSRSAINGIVHKELQRIDKLEDLDHPVQVLVNRQDMTGADRTWAKPYEVGNVIRYNTGSKTMGLEKGAYATVIATDPETNRLTVQKTNGSAVTYDPKRLHGASIYRPELKQFAVNERIQFTTPFKAHKIANRELGHITRIEGQKLTVRLDSGREVQFDTKKYAHIDHGYAVTSHSSQGLTTTRVLVNIDTERTNSQLISDRLAYVAISRARTDAHIYTNDAARLAPALSRDVSKSSAIAIEQPVPHTHTQQAEHGQEPRPPFNFESPSQDQNDTRTTAPLTQQHSPTTPAQTRTAGITTAPDAPSKFPQHANTPSPGQAPVPSQGQTPAPSQGKAPGNAVEQVEEQGFGF